MTTKLNKTVTPQKVRPIPEGYYTVTPFVITRDSAKLLDFVKEAFGAQELGRVYSEDGSIGHAETRIGDSVVMMFDARKGWPDTPSFLRLYVEDCDATYQNALDTGATSVTRPTNAPWGDRVCRVRDPLGNLWWIHTRSEDLSPEEMEKRWGQKEYIDAMEYLQGAQFFPTDK
jgi:PhnB protein